MADEASGSGGPFDLDRLRSLIEMMEEHGLTEVSLRRGEEQWRLRRGPQNVAPLAPPTAARQAPIPTDPATAPDGPAPPAQPARPEEALFVKSPTVGTFYAASSPDDDPFVHVGSIVQPDSIVCIVEAMKVFNQIPAEVSGTITEVLVKNGDSVEFGQPLFRVRPS